MCDTPNITRLSYRMSTFTDPIDIINDREVRFFFDLAMPNPFELYKLYVIQESDVGSSGFSCLNNFKAPDLNIPVKESVDVLNDECPILENNFEKSLTSNNESGSSSIVYEAGHIFNNKEEMKLELGKKCLLEHFEFKVDRSSKTRYEVSCMGDGCEWRFKAYAIPCGNLWFVKHMNDRHTCSKMQTHPHFRQANPKVLGHFLKEQLKDNGRIYRAKEIVKDFRQRFEVEITNLQAWRGKSYALELLQGTTRDSFAELPIYCYNLKLANPGSVTHILVDE
ncbi:putative transposase, MuDR, plant [Helianthus annuus]|nr:putative transposase, MuDR, plant [Helianthus annuus]